MIIEAAAAIKYQGENFTNPGYNVFQMSRSIKSQALNMFPVAIFFFHFLFCLVVLRVLDKQNIFPFSKWEMYSVGYKNRELFFLEFSDDNKNVICSSFRCKGLYEAEQNHNIFLWTQIIGKQFESQSAGAIKNIKNNLHFPYPLNIKVKKSNIDILELSVTKNLSGNTIEEFRYDPQ